MDGSARDAALDYYGRLVDLVSGKVNQAAGARELNAALSTVIAGSWMALDDGVLHAHFRLYVPDGQEGPENRILRDGFRLAPYYDDDPARAADA